MPAVPADVAAQSGQELVPRHQSGADEHRCPRHQPAIGEFHAGEPVIVHHEPGHLGVNDPDPTDGQPLTLVCGQGDPVWVRPHRTRPPPRRTPSRSPPPPSLRPRTVADNSGCRFRANRARAAVTAASMCPLREHAGAVRLGRDTPGRGEEYLSTSAVSPLTCLDGVTVTRFPQVVPSYPRPHQRVWKLRPDGIPRLSPGSP